MKKIKYHWMNGRTKKEMEKLHISAPIPPYNEITYKIKGKVKSLALVKENAEILMESIDSLSETDRMIVHEHGEELHTKNPEVFRKIVGTI